MKLYTIRSKIYNFKTLNKSMILYDYCFLNHEFLEIRKADPFTRVAPIIIFNLYNMPGDVNIKRIILIANLPKQ